MSDEQEPSRTGPLETAQEAAGTFWALIEKRVELAATEFQEQRHRLVGQLVWVGVITVLSLLALFSVTILLIVLSWNTAARVWVIGALTVLYSGGAVWSFFALKRVIARSPPPFSATIEEFKKDREWFRKEN